MVVPSVRPEHPVYGNEYFTDSLYGNQARRACARTYQTQRLSAFWRWAFLTSTRPAANRTGYARRRTARRQRRQRAEVILPSAAAAGVLHPHLDRQRTAGGFIKTKQTSAPVPAKQTNSVMQDHRDNHHRPTEAIWAAEPATTALMIARMHTIEKAGRNGSTAFTTFGSR